MLTPLAWLASSCCLSVLFISTNYCYFWGLGGVRVFLNNDRTLSSSSVRKERKSASLQLNFLVLYQLNLISNHAETTREMDVCVPV